MKVCHVLHLYPRREREEYLTLKQRTQKIGMIRYVHLKGTPPAGQRRREEQLQYTIENKIADNKTHLFVLVKFCYAIRSVSSLSDSASEA